VRMLALAPRGWRYKSDLHPLPAHPGATCRTTGAGEAGGLICPVFRERLDLYLVSGAPGGISILRRHLARAASAQELGHHLRSLEDNFSSRNHSRKRLI
jgi:hypothetical protein